MKNSPDENQEYETELADWKLERIKMMTSPASVITAAVMEACGSPSQTIKRITEGFSNEVYAVTTVDGQQVIVRIHWWTSPYFEEEKWALDQCVVLGIPTPQFLLLHHSGSGNEARSICVETRLPGQTLHTLVERGILSVADAYPFVKAAGALLAHVHSIPTTGWGRINAKGAGAGTHWSDLLNPSMIEGAYQAARKLDIAQQEITEAIDLLHTHTSLFEAITPRLLHGDFSPQQILVNTGQVTGLIDFEFPRSGDPAWDFAYWDYFTGRQPFRGSVFPTEWLLEGYRPALLPDMAFDLRVALWRLELGLELLAYHRHDSIPDYFIHISHHFLRSLQEIRQIHHTNKF